MRKHNFENKQIDTKSKRKQMTKEHNLKLKATYNLSLLFLSTYSVSITPYIF